MSKKWGITKLIAILLIFGLIIICCERNQEKAENNAVINNSEDDIFYQTPPFELKIIPEGILISLGDIPDDITSIIVDIDNWGDRVYTFQNDDYPIRRDMISSSMARIEGECLEQIKQIKEIIFPFVKSGEKYNVFVVYLKPDMDSASPPFCRIIAESGIYLQNEVELILNENNTSVRLSEEPKFTSDAVYSDNTNSFSFCMFNDEITSVLGVLSTDHNTNNMSWDFEPAISEQIKRSRELTGIREPEKEKYKSGDYTAFIQYSINIIYDNIEWQNYFIKSPRFNYTVQ